MSFLFNIVADTCYCFFDEQLDSYDGNTAPCMHAWAVKNRWNLDYKN